MTTHDIGRRLHCYGAKSVRSPNLDALAAAGVRFDRAFATAPQCSPSRASLATGLYPHNNGVLGLAHPGFDWTLAVPHAASVFAGHGFRSYLFGGQHVSPNPDGLGFREIHPTSDIDGVLAAERRDQRLYLEINFDETHRPYPPLTSIPAGIEVPGYLPPGPESAQEMAEVEATIATMDSAAGRVLAAFERAGRARDAIVVFTTDHGLAMPRAKCTLYDPGLEVALIIGWPAGFQPGRTRNELVSNIDVMPTLLEAAGLPPRDGIQGRSLLSRSYELRDAIFAEKTFHSYYDPMRCIRTDRYKFIRNFESAFGIEVPGDIQRGPIFRAHPDLYSTDRPRTVELYDLEADPLEQHNIAGDRATHSIEQEMSERLRDWMRETNDPLLNGPIASPRYRLAIEDGT